MLCIKKIFAVAAFIGLSFSAYAAITPLNRTEYGVSAASAVNPGGGGDDTVFDEGCGSLPSCPTINGCVLHNPDSSSDVCASESCCERIVSDGSFTMVETTKYFCPANYIYYLASGQVGTIYDLDSKKYCEGVRETANSGYQEGYWFLENAHSCNMQGWDDYNDVSSTNGNCGSYSNVEEITCRTQSSVEARVCKLSDTAGYTQCPAGAELIKYYNSSACSGTAPHPCYKENNPGRTYLAFTCDVSVLPGCSDIVSQYEGLGYYSSGLSDTQTSNLNISCLDETGATKYVGFFCQNYLTQTTCVDEKNGTTGSQCFVHKADGSSETVYRCSCGTKRTLAEFCAAEHPDNISSCMSLYHGTGTACTADKDETGATLYKYDAFDTMPQVCSEITNYKWVVKPEGSCPSFAGEEAPIEFECSPDAADTSTTQTVCLYCHNYMTETQEQAETLCVNGTPKACHWSNTETVYTGCDCDPNTYKTKAGWCAVSPYSSDTNCLITAEETGNECHTKPNPAGGYYSDDEVNYSALKCRSGYKTKDEWCAANPGISSCAGSVQGQGMECKVEGDPGKYMSYIQPCPEGDDPNQRVQETPNGCAVEVGATPYYDTCAVFGDDGQITGTKYICKCPPEYGASCAEAYEIRGGKKCNFDLYPSGMSITKYEKCQIKCGTPYAQASANEAYGCSDIDTYVSGVRGGIDEPEMCTNDTANREDKFICACPSNFKTKAEWCLENYALENVESANECELSFTGKGSRCERDIETDSNGYPMRVLTKYASFIRMCPTDRPWYYSQEDCYLINGEYAYSCLDTPDNGTERVICQCPVAWFNSLGASISGETCQYINLTVGTSDGGDTSVERQYPAEPGGATCNFDGETDIKYEQCIVKCSNVLNDPDVAIPNAYMYLSSDSGTTPTNILCTNQMGNGAVFGFSSLGADRSYCSQNHTIMYPCYCPADFEECRIEDNLIPADNARVCSINGKTYYSACQVMECPAESPTLAVIDPSELGSYGAGAVSSPCVVRENNTVVNKLQVTCDAQEYSDPCDYPYEAPRNGTWCKYGDGSTLMKDGRPHYMAGACRIRATLGECGVNIADAPAGASYQIFVASTESECQTRYGPGISTQLCEYGADQGYRRAYNCYYDPTDFKYTTANCGVRHDLTGNYIIINGKKHWDQCNCASAYKHHKFNCGGLLSGNPCQQELSQSLINSDTTLQEAVEDHFISVSATLPYYPYCQCSADYTEICDEDGSGRYKGVGTPCNGKYISCECMPDKLPDNWTDNYYGCPGGKKPTGVWKDNGCGKKYYQCSVVECTWEYTEMCKPPLLPVGQSCQDNEGNIGGYKACTCPDNYRICPAGQVGEGEPCNLRGVSYYQSCKLQEACTSLANETCTGYLQQGVNPCFRDGITYYESCVCANGYTEICGEGEVGVGNFCEINGQKYYKECQKPVKGECSEEDGYVTSCDTNQESYSPCATTGADGRQVVKYLCRCPDHWYTGSTCRNGTLGGERCLLNPGASSPQYSYSQCDSSETCSEFQELTYSVCTAAQTGDGGSCLSSSTTDAAGEPVTKYATCKDSSNCYETGFRYSCSGYDQSALGESCIDANGNKLYKSCPCPSSYVECPNTNATKGAKCVPLSEDGSFGAPLFSSCECDRSRYRYTCEPEESGNRGIIIPANGQYCEAQGITYYTSCDCGALYRYTCSDSAHGEVVPNDYVADYCQVGTTKFYKGCDCSAEYTDTAQACAAKSGQIANSEGGSCTIRGTVYDTSSGDDDLPLTGEGTSSSRPAKTPGTFYKGCVCKPNYKLPCASNNAQDGVPYCQLETDGDKLYPKCVCTNTVNCQPSGKNQGITGDINNTCTEKNVDASGNVTEVTKYTQCTCAQEYSIEASTCDNDSQYYQGDENFCALPDGNKYYKKCQCDPLYYDNTKEVGEGVTLTAYCSPGAPLIDNDENWFCTEISSESGEIRRPRRGACCQNNLDEGYAELTAIPWDGNGDYIATHKEELKQFFKATCGHASNAEIVYGCNGRKVYYKCINTNVAAGGEWFTEDECRATNQNNNSVAYGTSGDGELIGGLTMPQSWMTERDVYVYPQCGCGSNYNKNTGCSSSPLPANLNGYVDTPSCFNFGYKNGDSSGSYKRHKVAGVSCSFQANQGEKCTDRDGSIKYDWKKCRCKTGIYNERATGAKICCDRNIRDCHSCHYKYCVDSTGSYRTANVQSGNGGTDNGIVRDSFTISRNADGSQFTF